MELALEASLETRFDKDPATFLASGNYDPEVQREIIASYLRAQLLKQLALYGVAIVFILSACFLIVFSPVGREQTTVIVAAALLTVAIGLGGFSYFRIKAPLLSAEVGVAPMPASSERAVNSASDCGQRE